MVYDCDARNLLAWLASSKLVVGALPVIPLVAWVSGDHIGETWSQFLRRNEFDGEMRKIGFLLGAFLERDRELFMLF
ncbi:hypothetical protein L1987_02526 [Smallanthus sonchifolius]|uniref:Uncharacterized protein n=1 Tax=Smallanthus sonchifolius TaxID=185202 RepID=A0ACB9K8A0_9ASTR|nr:hypothetical protein L1987_02526 [Smallanthus sonchifolius]